VVQKNHPLVVIDPGDEWCAGRNRFAGKFKGAYLVFDHDIVAHVHTACSTLPAGKHHQDSTLRLPFLYEISGIFDPVFP
jgi:hypothetical protein